MIECLSVGTVSSQSVGGCERSLRTQLRAPGELLFIDLDFRGVMVPVNIGKYFHHKNVYV